MTEEQRHGEPGVLVVIGASAGGVAALLAIAGQLPERLGAAILITMHIDSYDGRMPELLTRRGRLAADYATDGGVIDAGRIYLAPPDHHLLVDGHVMRLSHGAKENFARPAIDPLFRSAAVTWSGPLIGVILTGMLDDGAAGLRVLKQGGGIAVVQDPKDADSPSMPRAALAAVPVDYCVPLVEIGPLITKLTDSTAMRDTSAKVPTAAIDEHELSLGRGDPYTVLDRIGRHSKYTCPDCGGSLWELNDSVLKRFRCHTGHVHTLRTLEHANSELTSEVMWSTLRALNEKQAILRDLASHANGETAAAKSVALDLADQVEKTAAHLRALLEVTPGSITGKTPDEPFLAGDR